MKEVVGEGIGIDAYFVAALGPLGLLDSRPDLIIDRPFILGSPLQLRKIGLQDGACIRGQVLTGQEPAELACRHRGHGWGSWEVSFS